MQAMETLKFLLVPLRSSAPALIALFSVLFVIAAGGGLLGLPLVLLVTSWFFHYGYAVLDQVADGHAEPPVLAYEMVNPAHERRPLGLLLLVAVFYGATEVLDGSLGSEAIAILRMVGVLLVPAIILAQAGGSFLQSLNPLLWLQILTRMPGTYALILAVLGFFWMVGSALVRWLPAAELPMPVDIPLPDTLRIAVILYAWLASFAMMGGAVYVQRARLGFEPTRSPERDAEKARRERERELDRLIDRIFAEWRGGAHGNAWRTIQAHLQQSPRPGDELRDLFERASQWPDGRLAHRLAQEMLPQLLMAKRTGDALSIVRSQLRADANFRPLASSDAIRLIELARDAGDRQTARSLLAGFAAHYPDETDRRIAEQLTRKLER